MVHKLSIGVSENTNEPENQSQEIICFYHRFNKVAAASFNLFSQELKIVGTSDNTRPDYLIVQTILKHQCYRQVIVNANIPNDLFELMKTANQHYHSDSSLRKLSSKIFNFCDMKNVITNTRFSNRCGMENYYLASAFNIADERLVCAAGGLLLFLNREFKTGTDKIIVNNICNILSSNTLWMDSETYKCLNIFNALLNPSHFPSSIYDNMEAFTLYSLIEKHCSLLGSTKLRHLMATPTMDKNILKMRHELINYYLQPENAETVKFMKACIDRLSPVSMLMANVRYTAIRGKHWKKIYQNIYYSVLFAETCSENHEGVQMFSQIKNSITDEMYEMTYNLDRIIDFEKMESNDVFTIKPGVCDSLEKAKKRFHSLMKQLNKVTPFEFDCVPSHVKEIQMIHIPETKFFLGIPYWKKDLTKEELSLPGLDYSFSANGIAYYKSKRCYELDELVGDPQTRLITEESRIIRSLACYIKQNIHFTVNLIDMIGDLDCIFAMAALAKEYNYTEPLLVEGKILNIKNGAHPLLSKLNSPIIPNSISSSTTEGGLINVIFGPNSSGKTVYLKQVAVHAYLAHIGSFLPAVRAKIGILNQIYTRISSTESIVANSSSFMNELRRLVTIISNPSSDSLVVIDEVGKGTTESDGVAILAGYLNYFFSQGESSPHIIISTHLDSIKEYLNNDLFLATHEMDCILDGVDFSFLYTVKPGGVSSHDEDISLFPLDVPDNITIASKEVLKSLRKGKDVIPCTKIRKQQTERIRKYLEKLARIHPLSKRSMDTTKHSILSFV